MKVIISAAGTAGHINPAIAIANIIKSKEKDSEIIFIGTERGLEKKLVPRAGYKLKTIDAYGLSKKISIDNLKKMYKTFRGIGQAKKIIKEFKPDIVIGTGGYICGGTMVAAKACGVPILLHESNAYPGKAIKMLAKKADTILVSFQDAEKNLTNCKNVVFTGTPVKIKKQEYGINQRKQIIEKIGLNALKPIVLVFGGSQGAQKINEAIIGIIETGKNINYQIYWATGNKQYDIVNKQLKDKKIDINELLLTSADSQKLFLEILNQAEKEINFDTTGHKLLIEASTENNEIFIFTITKYLEHDILVKSQHKKLLSTKKNSKMFISSPLIYSFESFDYFCEFCLFLHTNSNINFKKLYKSAALYLFNNNYYLVLDNLNLENSNLSFFYSSLLEFSVIEKYSRNFIFKLKEHGKVILKNNAITTCIQYFA